MPITTDTLDEHVDRLDEDFNRWNLTMSDYYFDDHETLDFSTDRIRQEICDDKNVPGTYPARHVKKNESLSASASYVERMRNFAVLASKLKGIHFLRGDCEKLRKEFSFYPKRCVFVDEEKEVFLASGKVLKGTLRIPKYFCGRPPHPREFENMVRKDEEPYDSEEEQEQLEWNIDTFDGGRRFLYARAAFRPFVSPLRYMRKVSPVAKEVDMYRSFVFNQLQPFFSSVVRIENDFRKAPTLSLRVHRTDPDELVSGDVDSLMIEDVSSEDGEDNTLMTLCREHDSTFMDAVILMMCAALKTLREKDVSHGNLRWENVYVTPVRMLYGCRVNTKFSFLHDKDKMRFAESAAENEDGDHLKMNGVLKIIDWSRSEKFLRRRTTENKQVFRSRPLVDTLCFMRCLRTHTPDYYSRFLKRQIERSESRRTSWEDLDVFLANSAEVHGDARETDVTRPHAWPEGHVLDEFRVEGELFAAEVLHRDGRGYLVYVDTTPPSAFAVDFNVGVVKETRVPQEMTDVVSAKYGEVSTRQRVLRHLRAGREKRRIRRDGLSAVFRPTHPHETNSDLYFHGDGVQSVCTFVSNRMITDFNERLYEYALNNIVSAERARYPVHSVHTVANKKKRT